MRKKKKDNWHWTNVFFGKRNWAFLIFTLFLAGLFVFFLTNVPLNEANTEITTDVCTEIYKVRTARRRGNRYIYFLQLQDGTEYQIPYHSLQRETGISLTDIEDACLNQTVTVVHSRKVHWLWRAYKLGELRVGDDVIISLEDTARITEKSNKTACIALGILTVLFAGLYGFFVVVSTEYSEWKKRRKILKRKKERQTKSRHG